MIMLRGRKGIIFFIGCVVRKRHKGGRAVRKTVWKKCPPVLKRLSARGGN